MGHGNILVGKGEKYPFIQNKLSDEILDDKLNKFKQQANNWSQAIQLNPLWWNERKLQIRVRLIRIKQRLSKEREDCPNLAAGKRLFSL